MRRCHFNNGGDMARGTGKHHLAVWGQKTPRTDLLTASRLDFGLTLLPVVGRPAVARMLAHYNFPIGLVVRVLASPNRREISD
jgi:hypothetical protein